MSESNTHFNFAILLPVLLLFLTSQVTNAQHHSADDSCHHCLMPEKSLLIGIGAPYSFHLDQVGLNGRIFYNIGEHICFGLEGSVFQLGQSQTLDFDLLGHYIFETSVVGVTPILGLNYTMEQELELEQAFGVVYGLGFHRNFHWVTGFIEYTRVESRLADQFIIAGLMFRLAGSHH